jgi:hypothetical protein
LEKESELQKAIAEKKNLEKALKQKEKEVDSIRKESETQSSV